MTTVKWQLAARAAVLGVVAATFSAAAGSNEVLPFKEVPKVHGDNEFCMDQQDGVYEHPDCRVYYRCEHQRVAEVTCPDGQVFDSSTSPNGSVGKSYCVAPEAAKHFDCSGVALRK